MSGALYNLAVMTVASTGTGTITLGSAATINGVTYLSFAAAGVPDGAQVYYSIQDPTGASEAGGPATYTLSGTTLTRAPVTSTNSNNAINMSAGSIVRITPVTSQFREIRTAARTYYVLTTGSDSNTGLANTASGAFLTIAKALSTVAALDCSSFQVTIQAGAGTFSAPVVLPRTLSSLPPILTGVGSTTVLNVTGVGITADGSTPWQINNMKIVATSYGLYATNGGSVKFSGIEFGSCSFHLFTQPGGWMRATGNYSISAGASIHAIASGGYLDIGNVTITLTGTPAFGPFAQASNLGYLSAFGDTFSGSATGARYLADTNSIIFTGGGGATYFPGNSAGSTATGGIYS